MTKFLSPAAFLLSMLGAATAYGADLGIARPWQLGFQAPATPVMQHLYDLHNFLLVVITFISVFVLLLLVYICLRYNKRFHPVATKTAHNTRLEIIWTTIPILILVVIAIPSLRLHYYMERVVDPGLTIKVTGYQWYWHYDYPDNGGFGYDSYIKKDSDLKPGDHRQLTVDNALVVPVNTKVRVLITGADVIHSWSVPAFGVKRDAIPGRLNDTWFEADEIGTFYGQCSQLCGVGHGFMPIEVRVVSHDDFDAWVKQQQKKAGITPAAATTTAPAAAPAAATPTTATEPVSPAASAPAEKPAAAAAPVSTPIATPVSTPAAKPAAAPEASQPTARPLAEKKTAARPKPQKPAPKKHAHPASNSYNATQSSAPPSGNTQGNSDDNTYPESYPDFRIRR